MNAFYFKKHLLGKGNYDAVVRRYVVMSCIGGIVEFLAVIGWFVVYSLSWQSWGVTGEKISLTMSWGI